MKILTTLFLFAATCTSPLWAQETVVAAEAKKPYLTTTGYPLDTCVVSDEVLDDSAKIFAVDGKTFMTCCKKCQGKIEKDPATFAAKKDAAVIKAQGANYPLDVCPVSGKPLGSMGEPLSLVLDNTLVKLCCKGCVKKATANKADIATKIQDAAFAKQAAAYATKTCPVSKHELDADAVSVMHGNTLVKLCCEDCMTKFKVAPNAFAAKVTETKAKGETKTKGEAKEGKQDGEPSATGGCCCSDGAAKKTEAGAECCETGKKPEAAPAKKVN